MTDQPDRDAAVAAYEQAHTRLNETITVARAEGIVADARIDQLAAAQKTAWRRVTAAKGRLTRAQRGGDPTRIAAARATLERLWAEADQIAEAGIAEMQQVVEARLDRVGDVLQRMDRAWQAGSAAIQAITPPAGEPGVEEP